MENKQKEIKECDFCSSKAIYACFECSHYFCENCYKFIHNKEKNSQHKREDIDPYVPIDIKCPIHPKVPLNLFCLEEKGKILIY